MWCEAICKHLVGSGAHGIFLVCVLVCSSVCQCRCAEVSWRQIRVCGSWGGISRIRIVSPMHPDPTLRCIAYLALRQIPLFCPPHLPFDASALGCATGAGGKKARPDTRHVQRSGAAVADHCQSDNLKVQTIGSVGLGYLHLVCVPLAHGKEEVEGFCGDETLVFAGVELGKQLGGSDR